MPRQGINIDIGQLDNDAFQPDPRPEIARILRELADKIENGMEEGRFFLRDLNGNKVGDGGLQLEED